MSFKNATTVLTLAPQTVYTVPALKEAVIHAIFVTPLDPEALVTIRCAGGHIGKDIPMVYGGSLYYPKPANLIAGDTIEASCDVDGSAEIFISILEQDVA